MSAPIGSPIKLTRMQLDALHNLQLGIAKEIKRICECHAIDYFLISGTLLGAVRHKGFIPWDDDMDIGMTRDSYQRFLEIAGKEIGPEYFIQTMQTDSSYGLPFAKVRLNGTRLIEMSSSQVQCHSGVFVDIFPFDNVPNSRILRIFHSTLIFFLKRFVIMHRGYTPWLGGKDLKARFHSLSAWLIRNLPFCRANIALERISRLANLNSTQALTTIGGSYGYFGEMVQREWVDSVVNLCFEDNLFASPVGSIPYLKKLYGNYEKVPPAHKQISRHGIVELDFGQYAVEGR